MRLADLATLNAERAARRAAVLVTDVASGAQRVVTAAALAADPLAAVLEERVRLGKSGVVQVEERDYFLEIQVPAVRLVLVGAVHIAQAMAPMARAVGLDVTVIDPREAFAAPERFPCTTLVAEWPQDALHRVALDRYTAVALLSHDPRIDDPALVAALHADCFYVGALGSRKTHARRCDRLRAAGFDEVALARIRAPIGLDIAAVSPAEIAIAVLAEIIAAQRRKPSRPATGPAA